MYLSNELALISHLYTPWKRQKTKRFLPFLAGMEIGHWREKGLVNVTGVIRLFCKESENFQISYEEHKVYHFFLK